MRTVIRILTLLATLLPTTAVAQTVTYDYDSAADFTKYKTYAWVRGTPLTDELNHKRVVNAIEAQLQVEGLAKAGPDQAPDVLVAYHATFDRDLQINGFSSGFGGYRFGGSRSGTARVEKILTGTLAVDIVDAGTKTIVWRGMATKQVDAKASPEKRERNIQKAVSKLFEKYPPKPTKGNR